ncbi:MAG: uracil-DNA glycosylase family protein [Myxococcota bacterium]|nr:uracil-DNA glycosylase family protein [Myxococcota bacterium]
MSAPPPDPDARQTLESVRALLAEWLEEGVEVFDATFEATAARQPTHSEAPPQAQPRSGGARSEPQASEVHQDANAQQKAATQAPPQAQPRSGGARSEAKPSEVHQEPRSGGARSEAKPSEVHQEPRSGGARSEPQASEVHQPAQISLVGAAHPFGEHPTLDAVREALGECTRCRLCEGRTQIVFGVGNPEADLLFIGEGPGEQEDLKGIPFVGRAGELLTQMIEAGLKIPRPSVYICNIVKCRPPDNRTPLADEVGTCRPYLDGQIAAVAPKVIVALGKPATSLLLGRDVAITRLRGTWQEYAGIPVMPTFHPAFVLRQYTPENRRLVWEDLKAALARARELGGAFPEPG